MTVWIWKHVILIKDLAISINKNVWNYDGNLLVLTSKSNDITHFFVTTWFKLIVGPLYVEYLHMASCCALREILSFSTPNHL